MAEAPALRLLAEDEVDLAVISAALQDAIAKVGDIAWEAGGRRLTLAVNRYRWEAGVRQRVRSALQICGVLQVQARKIRRDQRDAVIELLSIGFEPGEPPGGILTLTFAAGGELRVVVECIDAVLADISQPWPTPRAPTHGA
jgi:hypothetical protein